MAQIRHNFGEIDLKVPSPALLDIQVGSYQKFIQLETTAENRVNEGLFRVSGKLSYHRCRNIFVLEFIDYFVDPPRYSIDECMERGLTYMYH